MGSWAFRCSLCGNEQPLPDTDQLTVIQCSSCFHSWEYRPWVADIHPANHRQITRCDLEYSNLYLLLDKDLNVLARSSPSSTAYSQASELTNCVYVVSCRQGYPTMEKQAPSEVGGLPVWVGVESFVEPLAR